MPVSLSLLDSSRRHSIGCLALLFLYGANGPTGAAESRHAPDRPPDETAAIFESVNRLRIEIPEAGMNVLRSYHQVWGQPRPDREDVRASVHVGPEIYTNVAVHLKGSYTFQPIDAKPSLTLNFDKFARGQRFHGLDKIHLNNSVQDPSYLCEKLARDLFNRAGVPAARAGHARVELNGNDLGFYVLVESYNKRFLKRHFRSTEGNLYDGGSGGDVSKPLEVDSGDPDHREDLRALAAAAREPNPAIRTARLEQLVDVNRFLTFAALEVLLVHWDGYSLGPNNFRLFHDPSSDRFVFMPHGLDQILGKGASLNTSLTPKWDGLVARGLLKTPEGRRRYLDQARQVWTNFFQGPVLAGRIDAWAEAIRRSGEIRAEETASFDDAVNDLRTRVQRRAEVVRQQIEHPPSPVEFDAHGALSLGSWHSNRPTRPGVSHRQLKVEGHNLLEVQVAPGKWASASWRTSVLLGPGHYEFTGGARVMGVPASATNGVVLRLSGDVDVTELSRSPEWVELRKAFDVTGEAEEELVCEIRAPAGTGQFDLDTLRLHRVLPSQPGPRAP